MSDREISLRAKRMYILRGYVPTRSANALRSEAVASRDFVTVPINSLRFWDEILSVRVVARSSIKSLREGPTSSSSAMVNLLDNKTFCDETIMDSLQYFEFLRSSTRSAV